ncbi:unnamed protein product [Orchesella dallaii]|uniref:Protein kinase domain-containing protein n=1 Tax=Orchesella dallaii TaxID=48710 RepID=A0ABP1QFU3_9HEXA
MPPRIMMSFKGYILVLSLLLVFFEILFISDVKSEYPFNNRYGAKNGSKIVLDITNPVNMILWNRNISIRHLERLRTALRVSPVLHISSYLLLEELESFANTSKLITQVHQNSINVSTPLSIFLNLKYTHNSSFMDYRWDDLLFLQYGGNLTSNSSAVTMLEPIIGIILDTDAREQCQRLSYGTIQYPTMPFKLMVSNAKAVLGKLFGNSSSHIKVGFGYNQAKIGCLDWSILAPSDFFVMRIEFFSSIYFPESYPLFRDYVNSISSKNDICIRELIANADIMIRFRLLDHTWVLRDTWNEDEFWVKGEYFPSLIDEKYYILLTKFASRWAMEDEDHKVIIESYNYDLRIIQPDQNILEQADLRRDALLTANNKENFSSIPLIDLVEINKCQMKFYLDLIADTSDTMFVTLDIDTTNDFVAILPLNSAIEDNGETQFLNLTCVPYFAQKKHHQQFRLNIIIKYEHQLLVHKLNHSLSDIIRINDKDNSVNTHIKSFIFHGDRLQNFNESEQADFQILLNELETRRSIMAGCYLPIYTFSTENVQAEAKNIINETMTLCKPVINSSKFIVWCHYVNLEDWGKNQFSPTYYMKNVQNTLFKILMARDLLINKLHPNAPQIILHFDGGKYSSWPTVNPFCDPEILQQNTFYEAILSWAKINDFPIILKPTYSRQSSYPGFWNKLNVDASLVEAFESFPIFVRRHYIENVDSTSPRCITRALTVPKPEITFHKDAAVTLHLQTRENGSVTSDELQTMLLYALQKFKVIEIVLMEVENVDVVIETFSKDFLEISLSQNEIKAKEILIDYPFPILRDNHASLTKLLNFLKKVNELQTSPRISIKGIHISGWEENFIETNELVSNVNQALYQSNIEVGLVIKDCATLLKTILLKKQMNQKFPIESVIRKTSYLVCPEKRVVIIHVYPFQMVEYLDTHLYLAKSFEKIFPHISTHFRLATTSDDKIRIENKDAIFLKYVTEINEFSAVYNVNYFLFPAFELPGKGGTNGWWRIENLTDLANVSIYSEKESDYHGRSTLRPSIFKRPPYISPSTWTYLLIIALSLVLVITLGSIPILFITLRKKYNFLSKKEDHDFLNGTEDQAGIDDVNNMIVSTLKYNVEFEIPKKDVKICAASILGIGNFGTVYKARLRNEINVAVKMPNPGCTKQAFMSMLREIKVLCYIGSHPNVVSFLGCYTKQIRSGIVYIVFELCLGGSLQTLLRKSRPFLPSDEGENILAGESESHLSFHMLIKFAKDIAAGMNYVSNKKVKPIELFIL